MEASQAVSAKLTPKTPSFSSARCLSLRRSSGQVGLFKKKNKDKKVNPKPEKAGDDGGFNLESVSSGEDGGDNGELSAGQPDPDREPDGDEDMASQDTVATGEFFNNAMKTVTGVMGGVVTPKEEEIEEARGMKRLRARWICHFLQVLQLQKVMV